MAFNCIQMLIGRYITVVKNEPGKPITICEFEASGVVIQISGEFGLKT